ncbi:MAG: hypothetical protein PVH82_05685 [Desulfobacteraceae bacterium]|jgi:hypothetical protein
MITIEEEKYILERAYVPEHIVGLMTGVSGGEPFLIQNHFCCRKEDWVILVGYPLERDFAIKDLEAVIDETKSRFRPRYLSLIAPKLTPSLGALCEEKETDNYYTLGVPLASIKSSIRRLVGKAQENATVERAHEMGEAHKALTEEFIKRADPPLRVKNLFLKMPHYVSHSEGPIVLNAWDKEKNLTAFYVVDLAAREFSAYIIGCHSKRYYVQGASDFLCHEMVKMSEEYGKKYVHLGLGVNEGIRRFKKKWGGLPTRSYEMCELVLKKPSILEALRFAR